MNGRLIIGPKAGAHATFKKGLSANVRLREGLSPQPSGGDGHRRDYSAARRNSWAVSAMRGNQSP